MYNGIKSGLINIGKTRTTNVYSPIINLNSVALNTTNLAFAYSINRRLVSSYTGNLFRCTQVLNGTTTTINVPQNDSGLANFSRLNSKGLIVVNKIYDQSGAGNDLSFYRSSSSSPSYNYLIYNASTSPGRYRLYINNQSFTVTTDFADNSEISIYVDGSEINRGADNGFGNGWSINANNTFGVVLGSTYFVTGAVTSTKRIFWKDNTNSQIGIQDSSTSSIVAASNSNFRYSTIPLNIGFNPNGSVNNYEGWFSELACYTRVLSSTERSNLLSSV